MNKKISKWNVAKILMLVMASFEILLGFPVMGGLMIVALFWTPLVLALIGHVVTLIFATKNKEKLAPSIVGIVASVLGFIPFVGMCLHIAAAITGFVVVFEDK